MGQLARKSKKSTVQLTSLLDLLFVMVFLSLVQQKEIIPEKAKPKATPKVVRKTKPQPKPVKTFYTVKANFNFYGTGSNQSIPSGKYVMQGSYDTKTGKLQLGGIAWLNRPPQYDMVPLSGKINENQDTFTGRVESIGCKTFTLSRKSKSSGSPIAGEWVGTYNCSQGDTGLTLTIQ